MAAYAHLVSLMNTMDQIQIHPRLSTSFNQNLLKSLGDTVAFLLDFIESYNGVGRSKEVADLEGRIATAAFTAEYAIESHIEDLILAKRFGGLLQKMVKYMTKMLKKSHLPSAICDLQIAMGHMDSIKEDATKVEKQERFLDQTPHAASSAPVSARKASMVGFDDHLIHLMDKLTGQQSDLQVIPIVGMGGIGKTTLARNAFEHLLIKQHFDVCAWATISQSYSLREILLQLFSGEDQEGDIKFVDLNEHTLGEKMHKYLFGRRYLIVLDDVWSIEAWDVMKFFFPKNGNGSRVVVTTRLLDVAVQLNSSYFPVNLLDEDKSWNLFCQETFGKEGCPAELEEVGKKICVNCKGLPLSIVVIGGFLQKSSKSREYWEDVARDTYSVLNLEGDNQCLNILSLSYNHLPAHLKPCFLYMGIFAEDDEIVVSRLIQLWVAEGFLRPNDGQSLEEVAEGCLKDLVDRNLIIVNKWGSNGKMRVCNVHDLVRELCLMVADKENFLCVMNFVGILGAIKRKRRILTDHKSMCRPKIYRDLDSASLVDLLICKVLHRHRGSLEADLRCVNLRFLGLKSESDLHQRIPMKISFLWNLQSVRIKGGYYVDIKAPSELWEMIQLRHIKVDHLCLPDPPRNDGVDIVLPNLQTLWIAKNFRLSVEVCKRIPNVKKLGLEYSKCDAAGSYYCLGKLESLTLRFISINGRDMVLNMTFPSSLKKLSLLGGDLYWEDLEMIGSLPNLEVLKLRSFTMKGSEWNPVDGRFRSLKFLRIRGCICLTKWNAEHFHFPVLEKLVLEFMSFLDEIPSGIGDIPTLKIIRLFQCSLLCSLSAVKILEEQESYGNYDLQVEVVFHIVNNNVDADRFREIMEEEGFTSNNLHIRRAIRLL